MGAGRDPGYARPYNTSYFFIPLLPLSLTFTAAGKACDPIPAVPITARECELKLDKRTEALLAVFNSVGHPSVFRGDRKSYV